MRANLKLVELEIPAKTIQLPGLKIASTNSESTTYDVLPVFAIYLVNCPAVRSQCITQNIIEIKFKFTDTGKGQKTM